MSPDADLSARQAGRLRPAKRAAIMAGGGEVFARDGYQRASIDAIAAASGVSTRTIYKHFADKSALFAAVIENAASAVADEEIDLIERRLSPVTRADEVEPTLIGFAGDWLTGPPQSATRRALIGQVHAEAAHLGDEVVTTWWQAGPGRVLAEFAAVLARWSEAGLLRVPDADRAALHFSQLVSATPGPPTAPITPEERRSWIADGVSAFVRAYAP